MIGPHPTKGRAVHADMVKRKGLEASTPPPAEAPTAGVIRRRPAWERDLGRHGKHLVHHGIVGIAATRDRLHGGGVEPPVLDEAIVDMDAHHLSECDVAGG